MKTKKWFLGVLFFCCCCFHGTMYAKCADHVSALEAAKTDGSPITVKKYGEEEDADYSFRLKRTEHTTCTWSDTSGISDPKLFHQTGPGVERWGQIVTSDLQKGKISCFLTNMGSYKGKNTNLRITFMDWPSYMDEMGTRYFPLLGISLLTDQDFYGLTFGDIWYEAKLEILDDEGRPLAVNMTYRADDLDYGQIFGVRKNDAIDGLAVPEDSRVYYVEREGYHYFYADNIDSNEYEKDSVQVKYGNTSSFSLRVGGGVALPESFTYEKYVTEKMKNDYVKFHKYLIGEPSIEVSNQAGAFVGWVLGSARGYGPFSAPVPVKSTDSPEVHGEDPFHYFIHFKVPECQPADYYQSLVLTDPIPEALEVNQTVVYDADNQIDVSSKFHIQITKGTTDQVSVSVKDPSSSWIYGKSFEIRIQVQKRKTYVFQNSNITSNKASLRVDQKTPEETEPVKNSFYYQITTEVKNGSITPSDRKVPAGETKKIAYSPLEAYYLKSIVVDQTEVDKSRHEDGYTFSQINADHHIQVTYEKNPVIIITKEVKGRWDAFGTPVFLFEITGSDVNGTYHTYHEALEITESFQEEESYRASVSLEIPAGIWSVRELSVSRYRFTGMKEIVNGTEEGQMVRLNTKDHDTAKVTFCNEMTNYKEFSHNDLKINEFGK